MTNLKELQKQSIEIQNKIYDIENAERDKRNANMPGRCFKYINGYSNDRRWPYYVKIIRIEDGNLISIGVQHTSMDEVQFDLNKSHFNGMNSGWNEIPPTEFDAAWNEAKSIIENIQ